MRRGQALCTNPFRVLLCSWHSVSLWLTLCGVLALRPPRYTAKLESDEADALRGVPPSPLHEFMLHFVKMGFGVQKLMLEQMYAIGATLMANVTSEPR